MMEKLYYLDGLMEKLELSILNQENLCMLLMKPIIMELLPFLLHQIAVELFQEEVREKSEYGELENKLKFLKLHLKSIEDKF